MLTTEGEAAKIECVACTDATKGVPNCKTCASSNKAKVECTACLDSRDWEGAGTVASNFYLKGTDKTKCESCP